MLKNETRKKISILKVFKLKKKKQSKEWGLNMI
jgi:hypothetical protein